MLILLRLSTRGEWVTNNCQSCTHSVSFCGKKNNYLVCEHPEMDLIACERVLHVCKRHEYEAGTDWGENE